jgi:transmembrane 9 superfamily protein 2/4
MSRLIVLALAIGACAAVNFPGVVPRQWQDGDKVNLKVNRIDSIKTQLPFDYYSLPFCKPDEVTQFAENLGEILRGENIENSMYELNMRTPVSCKVLCTKKYSKGQLAQFGDKVKDEYRVHWIVDNLPAATRIRYADEFDVQEYSYQRGYPLGFVSTNGKPYIHNHVRILMKYRQSIDNTYEGSRIVGFEVEPYSIAHDASKVRTGQTPPTCGFLQMEHPSASEQPPPQALEIEGAEIVWTYDVKWELRDVRWAGRWDMYMMSSSNDTVHWFSIINSLVLVLVLAFVVALIMCRTLNSDIDLYNSLDIDEEDTKEETGWKLVHGDVFRPPANNNLMCALVGSGVQLYMCTIIVLTVACAGFLGPANRGALTTALLFFFACSGFFGGFASASLYKMFKGVDWKFNVALVALMYPAFVAGIMFILNLFIWYRGSSLAVPFGHMLMMGFLWLGISCPLVGVGAYGGLRRKAIELPCVPHQIPRMIPENPWLKDDTIVSVMWCLVGGLISFVPVFIEVFFIMSSIWLHHYTYMFGFLLVVFLILTITCAEVAIVLCYFQLVSEDYHWWWRSFFTAGSSAVYLFVYSVYYFYGALEITDPVSTLMYFCNMGVASLTFFLITGAVGLLSCLYFTQKIYAAIKVD